MAIINGRFFPTTSPKQDELRRMCQQKKYVLACGPRISGKTMGALHCIPEWCWRTPHANAVLLTISQTVGFDSGVWKELTETVIPEWINGNFGMQWVKPPFIMGVSKKPTCQISSSDGTIATIQLESLKNEDEVEDRFKPRKYGMIYVPELSTFRKRMTFDTLAETLRMSHLRDEQHLFLADTNPSDEGVQSWLYKLWFEPAEDEKEVALKRRTGRVDFTLFDNPFVTKERIEELKSRYSHDQDLYKRYILGEWVEATTDALFYQVFRANFHVRGEVSTANNPDPEILVPEANCIELVTGVDPGSSANTAWVIAEKTFRTEKYKTPEGEEVSRRVPVLKYIDELVVIDEAHTLEEFTVEFMRKMEFWEKVMGREGKVLWRHWSDRSAFDTRSAESNRYYHQIIYDASVMAIEDGTVSITQPIILQAADRGPGSVEQRIDLWKRLLFDERVFFSAEKTPKLIQMNKSIKRSKTLSHGIQKGSPHKHVFDAASYLAASECYDELARQVMMNMRRLRRRDHESSLVSVPV